MRKSTIALGISAALAAHGLLDPATAAAQGIRASAPTQVNAPAAALRAPAGSVLYDQSGVAANGAPSQNFSSTYDALDNASADDFVVNNSAGWDISQFNFTVSASADPSSATYDINVYPDAGGLPGTPAVCSYSALPGTLTNGNTSLSVTLPSPCHLDPGTYWVSEVANLDYAGGAGGQMFWSDTDPLLDPAINSPAVFQNPGDGFGTGCTSWSPLAACGGATPVGGGSNNFIFQVLGSVSGGVECTAGGICLDVTVALDNGNPTQCATSDIADIDLGDAVNFCYRLTNLSGLSLDYHSLMDNLDGTIFDLVNQPLGDGGSLQYNRYRVFGAPGTSSITASWTAQDVPPGYLATTTSGGPPITDRVFCDGFDGESCSDGGVGGFIDITTTGTATGLSDENQIAVMMPFSFNFYGTTTNQLCVSDNGGIIVGVSTCDLNWNNNGEGELPVSGLGAAILPLWDDFDSETGDVYYATLGTAPNRQFVVEWYDRVHYNGATNTDGATFEVIINEADSSIQFEYLDVVYEDQTGLSGDPADCTNGVCATIGLQQDDANANQFSFLTASVADNTGILWMQTAPQIFTDTGTVDIHVGAPDIDVTPTSVAGTTPEGGTSTAQFDIANVGDRDLDWTTEEAPPAAHFPHTPRELVLMGNPLATPTAIKAPHVNTKPMDLQPAMLGAAAVPSFGCQSTGSASCEYISFDAAAPGTANSIASESNLFLSGSFADNDFTKEYLVGYPSGDFFSVDTSTGALTNIGTTGEGDAFRALGYDPVTDTMYGTSYDGATGTNLVTVDTTTGAITTVGPITGIGASGYTLVFGLAIDSSGLMYGIEIVSDQLVAIDKTTGAATNIGSIGIDTSFGQGLGFDYSTGTLYASSIDVGGDGANHMYIVDPTTGAYATDLGVAGSGEQLGAFGIAIASGPCGQPQDLPWASLSPVSGTTAPAGSTPVTVTFDATGQTEGAVLSGTLCVNSNDPDESTVEVPVEMTVGAPSANETLNEDFADITTLPADGWLQQNNSDSAGLTNWNQGVDTVFPSQAGDPTAYISANYNNTAGTIISNWLVSPLLTFDGSSQVSFYTRTADDTFPDRLEVRLCTGAGCTDMGTAATDVGDFTTVLLEINPTLVPGGYPQTWTQYTLDTSSGLPTTGQGRVAFRYHVTDAGPTGTNSSYIGIDTVSITAGAIDVAPGYQATFPTPDPDATGAR